MDSWQAQDAFWNSFGIPAYEESTVPEDVKMPYITYSAEYGFFEVETQLTASIWYEGRSWRDISKKATEIRDRIVSLQGSAIKVNNGYLRLFISTVPFAQRMADENENTRRIVINIGAEFMTH